MIASKNWSQTVSVTTSGFLLATVLIIKHATEVITKATQVILLGPQHFIIWADAKVARIKRSRAPVT